MNSSVLQEINHSPAMIFLKNEIRNLVNGCASENWTIDSLRTLYGLVGKEMDLSPCLKPGSYTY